MSENEINETDDQRGESYLEIQMDRSTIVLAGLALIALLAGAFLLGSWFGSRSQEAAPAAESPAGDEASGGSADHDGEDVTAEAGFGGKPVSAQGAPPIGAVPTPARASAEPAPGPSPAGVADDAEVVEARTTAPARATAAKASAPKKATAPAKATAPKAAAASAPKTATASAPAGAAASAPAAAGEGWVIQVSAARIRSDAETLAARLRKKGYPVRLVEEPPYIKVHVGPYAQKPEAEAAERRLKRDEKLATWLKRG